MPVVKFAPNRSSEQKHYDSWSLALTQLHDLNKSAAKLEMEVERLKEIVDPEDDYSDHSAEFIEVSHFEIPGVELDYDQLYLLGRAKTKFDEYDLDSSGNLGANEVLHLADWVWNNFEPGGEALDQNSRLNLANVLLNKYDVNGDGTLNFTEFVDWFLETTVIIDKNNERRKYEEQDSDRSPEQIIDQIYQAGNALSLKDALRQAKLKYDELDRDNSGLLERDEAEAIADWALRAFQPSGHRIAEFEKQEFRSSLTKIADTNNDGKIDFDECTEWLINSMVDITKANHLIQNFDGHAEVVDNLQLYCENKENMHETGKMREVLTLAGALSKVRVKFRNLDENKSGFLEGGEVEKMGNWVWDTFDPFGRPLSRKKREKIRRNLLAQRDLNRDSKLDFDEFSRWFVDTCKYIYQQKTNKRAKLQEFDQISVSQSNQPYEDEAKHRRIRN